MKLIGKILCFLQFHDYEVTNSGGTKGHYWEDTKCTRCDATSGWSNY